MASYHYSRFALTRIRLSSPSSFQSSSSSPSRILTRSDPKPSKFLQSQFQYVPPHFQFPIDHRSFTSSSENLPRVGLFGKVKQLTKQYGSAALVVYGLLSAADFGLSFVTIYLVGAEHVRQAEDWLLEQLHWKRAISTQVSNETREPMTSSTSSTEQSLFWTTAIVAYTIHKTVLLPVRVGLTAWLTPPIVRSLRKRGWNVGKTNKP